MRLRLAIAAALLGWAASAPAAVPMKLWRLACGSVQVNDLNAFSDTRAYTGQHRTLTASCYLIRHGGTYMLWDTGLPMAMLGKTPSATAPMDETLDRTIVGQLRRIGVTPGQIAIIGISHYHSDHTGQAADFPKAKLLIGEGDLDALRRPDHGDPDPAPLAHWLKGGAPVLGVTGDYDVFGDGSVVMLDLPGHTPGHHGLLVRLTRTGPVILTGDTWHFREQVAIHGVPPFNTDRAASVRSEDRLTAMAAKLHAIVVIQHDPRDIARLPIFPAAAE